MSNSRPNGSARSSSRTRPMPPLRNRPAVTSVETSTKTGKMDITSTENRSTKDTSLTKQGSITNGTNIPTDKIYSTATRSKQDNPTNHFSYSHRTEDESVDDVDDPDENFTTTTKDLRQTSTIPKKSEFDRQTTFTLSPLESKLKHGGLAGLSNLGNTCFMNSVLQCLSNTRPLLLFCFEENLSDLLNQSSTSTMRGALMKEYASLIRRMWSSSEGHSVVIPSGFKNVFGRFASRFLGFAQQDSQEFLRYALQGLHEDVNRVQQKPSPIKIDEKAEEQMNERPLAKVSWDRCLRFDNSPISDIFAGQLKSTLQCTVCNYKSITFDMFWDLSIPLPRNSSTTTVQECLQLFMSSEDLDGIEKPMCAKCKVKRPCTKKFSIQKCPQILVLHLKRFSQSRWRAKLTTHVDFPITNLTLHDLNGVMSDSNEEQTPTYDLFGISNHSGTVYSGHYIAECKHPFTNQWHEFNDSSVRSIDTSRIVSSNAYVLFYERRKT